MRRGGPWAPAWLVSVLVHAGCAFDSAGLGLGPGTTGEMETSTAVETSSNEEGSTGQGHGSAGGTTGGGDETSDPAQGEAKLEFTDGPEHGQFGVLQVGETALRTLTLANVGDAVATQLMWSGLEKPFDFTDGLFPGVEGTCSDALDPGESCELELIFEPGDPGPRSGELSIHYLDAGQPRVALLGLSGYAEGATHDLLANGDAEACTTNGEAPPGWTLVSGSGWQCGDPHGVSPHEGRWTIYAGNEGGSGTFELRQDVDVSPYLGYSIFFGGWARSRSSGDDDYRIDLAFIGEDEEPQVWSIGWQTTSSWTYYEYASSVPDGTHTVSVRLFCRKGSTGSWCDAYFDALELRAVYDAPG
jgi:hypothetical protein